MIGKSTNIGRTMRMGSKATTTAMSKAKSTSMGMNRKAPKLTEHYASRPSIRAPLYRGSRAGLKDEKTVHLVTNNSGYSNSAHHAARYKPKRQIAAVMNTTGSMVYNSKSRMTSSDFRLSSSDTSSTSRLSKMVK